MKKEAYIIFECLGDPAKDLMGTAVAAALKNAYPERDIVVISHFPEVWLHNPAVYRVYKAGTLAYFYDEYVNGKDTLIFRHDPWSTTDFVYARKHIIDIWCELCGVERGAAMPSLHFTWREKEAAGKLTVSAKPLFFIHATAGDPATPSLWQKDLPLFVAQDIVNRMNGKGYQSVQVREAHQPQLQNALTLEFNLRQMLAAISFSSKRLFIDSFMLQAATALGMPSVATFTAGSPAVTSYDMHANIAAFSHLNAEGRKMNAQTMNFVSSYKDGYDINGMQRNFPYPPDSLYDADTIIKALDL